MTIAEAIALAGGFDRLTAPRRTIAVRDQGNRREQVQVPADATWHQMPLAPNDIVWARALCDGY